MTASNPHRPGPGAVEKGATGSSWDLPIYMAIAAIAVAVGAGLAIDARLPVIGAMLVAAGVFLGLLFLHVVVRRLQRLSVLRSRVEALERVIGSEDGRTVADTEPAGENALAIDPDAYARAMAGDAAVEQEAPEAEAPAKREPTLEVPAAAGSRAGTVRSARVDDLARQIAGELSRNAPASEPMAPDADSPPRLPAADKPAVAGKAKGSDETLGEVVRQCLVRGDLEIHLQPIVGLRDRKPRLYEIYPRLRRADGSLLYPGEFMPAAVAEGLQLAVEKAVMGRTARIAAKLTERGRARGMCCGVSGTALSDRGFVHHLLSLAQTNRPAVDQLVLEVGHRDYEALAADGREGMAALGRAGYRFSIDRVEDLSLDLGELVASRVCLAKMAPALLSRERETRSEAGGLTGWIAMLRQNGIEPVVESVQDEIAVGLALELGLELGQGGFLSEPRPLRPEVLGEGAGGAGTAAA